jgi:hypothetical protein
MKRRIKKFPLWVIGTILFGLSIPAISWTDASLQHSTVKNNTEVRIASSDDNSALAKFDNYIHDIFQTAGLDKTDLNINVLRKALVGYYNLKHGNFLSTDKSIITIVDFNKPSTEKRLWIIDLVNKKLLFHTLVAHGQGSGDNMAQNFSNTSNSNQSSLGFYVANETYFGKHGLSLKLDGMDEGFNTNARNRGVVVHGADYVSQAFIDQHGRLGRSWGCPALPAELTATIINTIKGKTCLYIDGPTSDYSSSYLDQKIVLEDFAGQTNTLQASL